MAYYKSDCLFDYYRQEIPKTILKVGDWLFKINGLVSS